MLSPNGSSATCIADCVFHIPMPCFHGALPVYPQVFPHSSKLLHGATYAPTTMANLTACGASEFRWALAYLLSTLLTIPSRLSRVPGIGLKPIL